MTNPAKFFATRRSDGYCRHISCFQDFLEAVSSGEDPWGGSSNRVVSWVTDNASAEYNALKGLGWSAGSDYGSYGMEDLFVYSPYPDTGEYRPNH